MVAVSVTFSMIAQTVMGWSPVHSSAREELWDALTDDQRWELGMAALRARPADAGELRWSPDVFARMGIEHDHNAEELVRSGLKLRLVSAGTPA